MAGFWRSTQKHNCGIHCQCHPIITTQHTTDDPNAKKHTWPQSYMPTIQNLTTQHGPPQSSHELCPPENTFPHPHAPGCFVTFAGPHDRMSQVSNNRRFRELLHKEENRTSCGCNQTMNSPNCQHALVPFCGPTQNLSQVKKCLGFPWGQERSRHGNYEQIFWHLVKWILECCLKTPTINSTQKSDTLLANFKINSSTTTTARKMLGFPSEMRRSWHRNCEQIF